MKTCVKIKKLDKNAKIPSYGTDFSAGADLYSCSPDEITVKPGETVTVHTGLAMEIPADMVGLVYARSGLASKRGLAPSNKVGVIDSDYRGEIMVSLHNHSNIPQTVAPFERVAQIVFTPYFTADFEESQELSDTVRGNGGFGSTGTK